MMSKLHRKLIRDVLHMRGQVIAITLVVACGVSAYVTMRSAYASLLVSQQTYYARYRFADVFAGLKRAPVTLADAIAAIPGVAGVRTRIVMDVALDIPGLDEPATGRLVSMPDRRRPVLNDLFIREGRYIEAGRQDEVLISEAFANANALRIGDRIGAIMNGRWKDLRIVGIALSPEYVYEVRGTGSIFPDNKRFGVMWMSRDALAAAFDMQGAFNDVTLALAHGANESEVIARLDRLIERYGGLGAYSRESQISHRFLADEIAGNRTSSTVIPAIFLGVAAFLLHIVLSRLVRTQRDQIAILKAFGYSHTAIGLHYLLFALISVGGGIVLGAGMGVWFAMKIAELYTDFYHFPVLQFQAGPRLIVYAALITAGAAFLGALSAMRSAVALPPAEAMRPEPPERFKPLFIERFGWHRMIAASTRMIVRNIERRPWKTMIATLGISFAVAILVIGRYSFDAVNYMMDFQFRTVQREDVSVAFYNPRPARVKYDLAHLPGVMRTEPYRAVPVRLRFGHRSKLTSIFGLASDGELRRLVDRRMHILPVPPEGVVLTNILAEMLGVKLGDDLIVEVLEGARPVRRVRVAGLVDELIGVAVYMDIHALNRIMREGETVSGAFLDVDQNATSTLYTALKQIPAVSGVTIRAAALQGFEDTIAESLAISTTFLILFASVIACGMVYNGARIALSERGRELASLRVLGFTTREITVLLLGEQAFITLMSIPIGFVIGWWLCFLIARAFASELYRMPVVITGTTYAFAFIVIAVAAVCSGWLVRRRLYRLDLIAVLKTRE